MADKPKPLKCEDCGRVVEVFVAPGGWCFAKCACRSTWPSPVRCGTEALAAWNRRAEDAR